MVASGVVTGVTALINVMKDRVLYSPNFPDGDARFLYKNPEGYRNPGERNFAYEDVYLDTDDGLVLHGWHIKQADHLRPTILFFHGNAGNMGMRMDNIEDFYVQLGVNIFILSYRGYGKSQGHPTEEGLKLDAKAAIEYLFSSNIVNKDQVFIFGRSLGGAVGIYATNEFQSKYKIRGLILENTFTSINDIASDLAPSMKALSSLFLQKQWPSLSRIRSIRSPILFISGRNDLLIAPHHMDSLHQSSQQSAFTEFHAVAQAGHNDTYSKAWPEYLNWMNSFITKSLLL